MKRKNGKQTQQAEIATQIVELALERVTPIDGTPLSLILPKSNGTSIQEVIATGLKQFDGAALEQIIILSEKPGPAAPGQIHLLNQGSFDTPVGKIEIDRNLSAALMQVLPNTNRELPQSDFYAEFNQVFPFLKRVCPFAKVTPLLLENVKLDTARGLAITLADMLQGKKAALIVLSNIEDLTRTAVEFCDADILLQTIPLIQERTAAIHTISHACLLTAVQFAQSLEGNTAAVLKSTPHDSARSNQNVYQSSIMLFNYTPPALSIRQQTELITLAKQSIQSFVTIKEIPKFKTEDPAFLRKTGLFVTIRQQGALRGCIGRLQADLPLYKAVQDIAVSAATSDPRFPPIESQEIDTLSFKIAILSPLRRITSTDVQVGTHGLLIAHQGRRGVLLPDVPVSRGWGREEFLTNLCYKAGLPPNAWRDNPTLYAFTTVEFGS
ncbi:MAG TPA: AmmeMemoRadiSam system protein A [Anaerolineales bacterium]|nr:AmmeMemoRadiSam system protein A [Anaerolineales bacterium]